MHHSFVAILLNVALIAGNMFTPASASSVKMESEDGVFLNRALKQPWEDSLSSDDIRCHCNLPICITTGYMCRTNGGCFSEVKESADDDDLPARHGCMHLLEDKHLKCNLEGGRHQQIRSSTALLRCCQEDMCNHVDTPDNKRFKSDSRAREGDHSRGSQAAEEFHSSDFRPVAGDESHDEVWFKTATIAITVCGAIILLVLIAAAVRMLRSDGRHLDTSLKLATGGSPGCSGRKIILDFGDAYNQVYGGSSQQNVKQAPLLHDSLPPSYTIYPPPHYHQLLKVGGDSKNEAQAKKNQIKSLEYTLLPQSCHEAQQKPINTDVAANPAFRDVNLRPAPHGAHTDAAVDAKTYEKDAVPANWTNNSRGSAFGV
ncbi:uncharacterized protein LOC132255652 [Phlebotomus argentipes]|uniref:uncharacterized protein LOC132255652 n=1 Tax=Phlebotomus argentipes TaxID=94469 RepID=UPI0028933C56|nr:uncharacterized protein LOC132255652 [Phlebotomus argentipes]